MKVLVVFSICVISTFAAPSLQITGGHDAKEGQYPYQASIQGCITGICQHGCGGTILNKNWVLTSARCIKPYPETFYTYRVLVGSLSMYFPDAHAEIIHVSNHTVHPKHNSSIIASPYDIALMKLEKDIVFNDFVQPAKLPEAATQPSGEAVLTGWGTIANPPNPYTPPIQPLRLQTVDVPIIGFKECLEAVQNFADAPFELDKDCNVCTLTKEISMCSGDSGDPLAQNGTVVGVASWGITPCGQEGAPTIYTNTASFIPWINSVINEA